MSFGFTCYFNDENIALTTIRSVKNGEIVYYSGEYGDEHISVDGLEVVIGFEATPADNCLFTHWVYRLDTVTSEPVYESTDKSFYYNQSIYDGRDIFIRAVGTPVTCDFWIPDKDETSFVTRLDGFSGKEREITIQYYLYAASNPSELIDQVTKTSTPTANTRINTIFRDLTPGTQYIVTVSINDTWWDTIYVTTDGEAPSDTIDPWSWRSTIASGAPIKITASEWNDFCDYINGVREAKGMTSYSSFTTVVAKQTKISAAIVNQAHTAISQISGHGTLPAAVSSGDPITASFFIKLAEAINVFASEG